MSDYKAIKLADLAQEIAWLERQIKERILTEKNRKEYLKQIRHKEIEIACIRSERPHSKGNCNR